VLSLVLAAVLRPKTRGDDEALLGRVARQDRAALRTLYDRWASQSLAVALRVLGSRADAEEVIQETFVEVWRRAAQFDVERGSGRSWVMAIARNRSIDRLRHRAATARLSDHARDEDALPRPPTPLEDVEQREARDRVRAALMSLQPEQRRALELAYYEGLSQSEISEKLGEPLGTVKSRVRLAMEKLATLLPAGERRS
jgi:RNA polymerase sigma-70 factor (ECF subfamily)